MEDKEIQGMDVSKKAAILKENPLVESGLIRGGVLAEIFLSSIGVKPVSAVVLSHMELKGDRETWAWISESERRNLENLLEKLGLYHNIEHYQKGVYKGTSVEVALKKADLENFIDLGRKLDSERSKEIGLLLGYPKTAVEAFERDKIMDVDEQTKLLEDSGVNPKFARFRFSKEHFLEELETVKKWYDICCQNGFTVYE